MIVLVLVAVGLLMIACEEDSGVFTIGEKYIESQTDMYVIDTLSVKLSTVILDDIQTSGTLNMLIGSHNDELIGKLSCHSYFQLGAPNNIDNIREDDTYDSLKLVIRYNGYYFGDTTKTQKISVHRLTENIEIDKDQIITSATTFNYNPVSLGSKVFTPRPKSGDTLSIRLSDDLGSELFSMIQNNSIYLSNNSSFVDYFHGLVLVGDDTRDASVLGFNVSGSNLKMILYTSRIGFDHDDMDYEFAVYDTSKQFNNIAHDFSSTELSPLTEQRYELPSSETSGLSFMQGGIGLMVRVDFPSLSEILLLDRGTVARAQLTLAPMLNSGDEFGLPPSLVLYETDKMNEIQSEVTSSSLTIDDLYDEKTAYSFELTNYFQNELEDSYVDPEKGLLLGLPSFYMYDSFYRLIVDSESKNTKLKLYYLSY